MHALRRRRVERCLQFMLKQVGGTVHRGADWHGIFLGVAPTLSDHLSAVFDEIVPQTRMALSGLLHVRSLRSHEAVRIVYCHGQDIFNASVRKVIGVDASEGGVCLPGLPIILICGGAGLRATLRHELCHAFCVLCGMPSTFNWGHEGLACLISAMLENSPDDAMVLLSQSCQAAQGRSLRSVLCGPFRDCDYATAECFTRFLWNQSQTQPSIWTAYCSMLHARRPGFHAVQRSLVAAFGQDWEYIETRFRNALREPSELLLRLVPVAWPVIGWGRRGKSLES